MKLEVIMSCMHQQDDALVQKSRLTGDVVVINQCDEEAFSQYPTENGTARFFSVRQRGLTRSRNMGIREARADICLLCDDDEVFVPGYEDKILTAWENLPQADVVVFKIGNLPQPFPDQVMRLRFPKTMKVCSPQISLRRERILDSGVSFDELMGAGTPNGAEEELKFLTDCEKAGLRIYYAPVEVASLVAAESTWFRGYTEAFFENRGATTRYILGAGIATAYAVYYVLRKRNMYRDTISPGKALRATLRGIRENKIGKQAEQIRRGKGAQH